MIVRPSAARFASSTRAGFTLLEVMVVLAILVIIASLATFAVMRSLGDAKVKQAQLQMQKIDQAIQTFYITEGQWPQSLEQLIEPTNGRPPLLPGGVSAITSPWMQIYQFEIGPDQTGTVRPIVMTQSDTGQVIVWPEK